MRLAVGAPLGSDLIVSGGPSSAKFNGVSVLQTVLAFVVPSVGLYVLIALLTARWKRRPRYRAGGPWPFEPLLWTANPPGAELPAPDTRVIAGERGGARGDW